MNDLLDDKIFQELRMDDLSAEEKSNFSKSFFILLNTRVNARLVEKMNQEQQDEYIKLIGDGDEKMIEQFKMQVFPNIKSIVDEECEKLKSDIIAGTENLLETPETTNQPTQPSL